MDLSRRNRPRSRRRIHPHHPHRHSIEPRRLKVESRTPLMNQHDPNKPGPLDSFTAGFTDADLQRALLHALRLIGMMVLIFVPVIWIALDWRSVMLFLTGAIISAAGIWEGRRLMAGLAARIENQPTRTNLAVVMALFVLRLG